jgi:hypothetical protein
VEDLLVFEDVLVSAVDLVCQLLEEWVERRELIGGKMSASAGAGY